ncbi:MAG: hypothetical protein B6244_08150 [Candidatus Cloacimonetes bacterium 4572_55]|nr:MAG: hypothetical protein B6244_08150 [Candidatus Cloacimonetes bacterium 4572_55]
MHYKINMNILILFVAVVFLIGGCRSEKDDRSDRVELRKFSIKTIETSAQKDTETSPEQGGYGFEDAADSLGFQTSVITEDEQKFFGGTNAKKGGMLTSVVSRFPPTLRTYGQNSNYLENSQMNALIYEGLMDLHSVTMEFIPRLATHWKLSDDKMQFWFRINPDARWSDGKPVISDDVVATWRLLMDETILFPSTQLTYGKFEVPVAESKYIVSVKCKEMNWRNLIYFGVSMSILPAHYIENLTGVDYLEEYQFKMMPGSGPYIILQEDIKNQISYTITRRSDYWDRDHPLKKNMYNFDKIKFIVVKDNTSLEFEKFKKGEQDFYMVSQARRWAEETDFDATKKGWIQKRKIYSQKPSGTSGYIFNMRRPPFDDKRVRYAFCYLFNRRRMNEEMYYSEYGYANSVYSGTVYENPNNEKTEYDPEKAMQLLTEAGWTERNQEGWLVKDGTPFQVSIGVQKVIDYMVTPYQQMLREYGIDLQITFMDGNTLWDMLMERNFEISYFSLTGLIFPNPETSSHSSLADQNNNNNFSGIKNARIDELCELYDKEFSQQKRVEMIREIDGILMDIRPFALSTARLNQRLMFWDKFGFPEYMADRYVGDYESIYKLWWFEPDKVNALSEAMENDTTLPIGELENKFWMHYLEKELADQAKSEESQNEH